MNEQNNERNLEEEESLGSVQEPEDQKMPPAEDFVQESVPTDAEESRETGESELPQHEEPGESSDEAPVDQSHVEEIAPVAPTVIYRWDYNEQEAADTKHVTKTRKNGVLTFAIVMSVCFALTLLALIAALVSGGVELFDPKPDSDYDTPGDDLPSSERPDTDIPYGDGNLEISNGDADALTLQQISAKGNQVVVAISVTSAMGSGSGTGIIMTEDGYIATNHHVIEDATSIKALLYDGREYEATLVGSSEIDDLAVIKIEEAGLPIAVFGDSSTVMVGDRAVVIGHPAGLEFGWTSTYGFISAINRDVKIRDYDGTMTKKMTLLQTDADVNSGNSGGPMFNNRGEVIGIITMKLAGNYEGMGFAIPSNGAVPLLEALMKTGTTDGVQSEVSSARPELGITGVSVTKDHHYVLGESRIYELTEQEAAETEGSFRAGATGVLITAVVTATDAYDKISEGDIVTSVDGRTILATTEIREILYDKRVGDTVDITLIRGEQEITVTVQLRAAQS